MPRISIFLSLVFLQILHISLGIYHNQFAVELQPDADPNHIAQTHGFVNLGQIGSLKNHYLFEHPRIRKRSIQKNHTYHENFKNHPQILWFEQQKELIRHKRNYLNDEIEDISEIITDPLFSKQWFLNHGAVDGSDMNVITAWERGFTGKNVVVTILDDGIQVNHPDLAQNFDPMASTDINNNDEDPTPRDDGNNKHGTRCAGEVAAVAFNDYCGVGIAYNASIGGKTFIYMINENISDLDWVKLGIVFLFLLVNGSDIFLLWPLDLNSKKRNVPILDSGC